jgi:Glycosyltransferase family 10 (fucosyltransferase) C-term
MLIRIEKDWAFPNLNRQSPADAGLWGDLELTYDPVPECDLLLVLNSPNRDIRVRCPKGNRWLFSQESPTKMYQWHRDSFKYFDKVFSYWDDAGPAQLIHAQTALPWHIGKSYDQLSALTADQSRTIKRDAVSWVTSAATHKEGHRLRMAFKDYLCAQNFDFDLWGRGFTPIEDKFDGIHPYKYSIAIENYGCNDYWTEKIADCFLSWTIPIYWGATNILSYFPANSMILIDPTDGPGSLAKIRAAMEDDFFGKNLDALAQARDLVLNRYQMFPHLAALTKTHAAPGAAPRLKTFIPAHPIHYAGQALPQRVKTTVKRLLRL